jgi:PhnB protein
MAMQKKLCSQIRFQVSPIKVELRSRITSDDKDISKQTYEALQQEGQINMPLQETFFSPAYGIVTDKFGVTFQIFTVGQH